MLPAEPAEPIVQGSAGSSVLRTGLYGALAILVAAGAWIRFNPQIAAVAPALAGPAGVVPDRFATANDVRGLVELAMLPASASQAAIAEMALPPGDAALLLSAVRRGRYRLVQMPLVDASPTLPDAQAGHSVEVSTAGYTRLVQLTRVPVAVTLPIGPVGEVAFRTAGTDGVGIGTMGLAGPLRLPELHAGQVLDIGVIAQ